MTSLPENPFVPSDEALPAEFTGKQLAREAQGFNHSVVWRNGLLFALVSLIGSLGLACLFIPGMVFGIILIFLGVPFGLVALIYSTVKIRRIRRDMASEAGLGSAFKYLSQTGYLFLNALLIVVFIIVAAGEVLLKTTRSDDGSLSSYDVFGLVSLGAIAILAVITVVVASFTVFSPKRLAEEEYAISHKLPAAVWLRTSRVLRWVVFALYGGSMIYFWIADALIPALSATR